MTWFNILKNTNSNSTNWESKQIKPQDEQFMIKDDVWAESGLSGQPSLEEVEEALGRKLVFDDFTSDATNWENSGRLNLLLETRIGRDGIMKLVQEYIDECEKHTMPGQDPTTVFVPKEATVTQRSGIVECVYYSDAKQIIGD